MFLWIPCILLCNSRPKHWAWQKKLAEYETIKTPQRNSLVFFFFFCQFFCTILNASFRFWNNCFSSFITGLSVHELQFSTLDVPSSGHVVFRGKFHNFDGKKVDTALDASFAKDDSQRLINCGCFQGVRHNKLANAHSSVTYIGTRGQVINPHSEKYLPFNDFHTYAFECSSWTRQTCIYHI